ncbi:MAG: hypothetical protein HQK55_16615 [Deltaproteobacteria bacterium]|nr:hypothetical protein [Deltaproteobacteria bacterium]
MKKRDQKESGDVLSLANRMSSLIDKTAWDIFSTYRLELLAESIAYIVPAIWGARKDGELTPVQKAINDHVEPIIKEIFTSLSIKGMDKPQEFALSFLIRGLIISKITYMIEAFRNRLNEQAFDEQKLKEALTNIKPHGTA